ncbi:MAG: pyridoxamine 5'-phosphate oxidase-like FMN-binding protein [Nitrospirae bacterium]|nr:MAG: pyridoxamine 5'-phosphate oxidase-like FMN-binding protein [Nitrospirota bacterium]
MHEIEKLVTLLTHWQTHETDHASAYRAWAQKAHAAGHRIAGGLLEQIAASSENNRVLFAEALASIANGRKEQKSGFDLPNIPVGGNAALPGRLRELNARQRSAVLATSKGDYPYTSLVGFALTQNLKGALFLTPKNTLKYRNLMASPHVALLIDNRTNTTLDLLDAEAVTLIGTARALRKGKRKDELTAHFLRKHPNLQSFAETPTTALVLIEAERYIHVSRFQAVTVWEVTR